ncbi:MAG TPA: DHA2 family efflux MFS transporter permease subunit [Acidimicrobiales bacterium]|nr:DHA2 family efflux MFS transporter permease subunit [Acidimicrobiales bacterium]
MAGRTISQKVAIGVVYVMALFMAIMDTTIVNVALPTLGRDFHVRSTGVDAVVIGFLVSMAVFIPASGWLGDRIGPRRVLLASIVIFTVASALCGVATSLGELSAFRVLQGVGGGLMTPVGMTMLWRAFPPAERIRASAILIVPTAFAPALGPVLGGLFVTDLSWRWVFYVNVPIGIAALVFGRMFLREQERQEPGPFDLWGFVLSCIGLGSLMYGLSEGPVKGWHSSDVVITSAVGAAFLVALVVVEMRQVQPLISLRLFRDRLFRSANAVMFLGAASFLGVLYLVALFFQYGLGMTALGSGLSTFPEALGVMLGSQIVTRQLYPRLGPRRLMAGGLVALSAGIATMALVGDHTDLWLVRLLLFGIGLAMSHVFVPTQAAAFATISPADMGRASTFFNAQRQVGGAIGVAVLTTVLAAAGATAATVGHPSSHLGGYHAAFLAAAGLALLGSVVALSVNDEDAAETIVRRTSRRVRGSAEPAQVPQPVEVPA